MILSVVMVDRAIDVHECCGNDGNRDCDGIDDADDNDL